jgi:hypothetical protein
MLLFTGFAALAGGVLLVIRPDGTLLQAKLAALAGTPFRDWRTPGVLLATLVGGGGLATFLWLLFWAPYRRHLAAAYALALLGFEIAELAWIGFQVLEVVFGLLALLMLHLALTSTALGPEASTPPARVHVRGR